MTNILNSIHYYNFNFRRRFGDWTLYLTSSKKPTLSNPVNEVVPDICCNKNMMIDNIRGGGGGEPLL
jgi:hypothetical protein